MLTGRSRSFNTVVAASIVAACVAVSLLPLIGSAVMYAQGQRVWWLITLTPLSVYIYQPVVFKAYAYNPQLQEVYDVQCNITIVTGSDVYGFYKVSGTRGPAERVFYFEKPGSYMFHVYCRSMGEMKYTTFTVSVAYPTPTISIDAPRWGRSLRVRISLPYPYHVVGSVRYRGSVYTVYFVNGVADITLPPVYEPEVLEVTIFGKTWSVNVTPALPTLSVSVSSNTIRVDESAVLSIDLVDDIGKLSVRHPVSIVVSGPCRVNGKTNLTGHTNSEYVVTPVSYGTCEITVSTSYWSGVVEEKTVTVEVLEPSADIEVLVTNTTSWHYTFTAIARVDSRVRANFTLFVDGEPVRTVAAYGRTFGLTFATELYPGVHTVSAVLRFLDKVVQKDVTVYVPRHPYRIEPPPSTIYAGDEISLAGAYWYVSYVNGTAYLVGYYPGDDYYAPASALFRVNVVYPVLNLTESRLVVQNAAPGALVDVYCVVGKKRTLIMEIAMKRPNGTYALPRTLDCDYVEAVYRYKAYTAVVRANEPEPIVFRATACLAGAPCDPVAPSEKIELVVIGDRVYEPGTPVRLRPGLYTVRVYLTDGHVVEQPLIVYPVNITVRAYETDGRWIVEVSAPQWAAVTVVLSDGSRLQLRSGTYTLSLEPVSAFWPYGDVEFVKAEVLKEVIPILTPSATHRP